jgi:excisionase family DNA binding protein
MSFLDALRRSAEHQARIQQIESSLDKDFYTVAEVADILNVHRKTVEGWIRGGELNATRPSPRKTRIWKSDLVAYLARRGP